MIICSNSSPYTRIRLSA